MHCVDLGESFPTSIYLLNLPGPGQAGPRAVAPRALPEAGEAASVGTAEGAEFKRRRRRAGKDGAAGAGGGGRSD